MSAIKDLEGLVSPEASFLDWSMSISHSHSSVCVCVLIPSRNGKSHIGFGLDYFFKVYL